MKLSTSTASRSFWRSSAGLCPNARRHTLTHSHRCVCTYCVRRAALQWGIEVGGDDGGVKNVSLRVKYEEDGNKEGRTEAQLISQQIWLSTTACTQINGAKNGKMTVMKKKTNGRRKRKAANKTADIIQFVRKTKSE